MTSRFGDHTLNYHVNLSLRHRYLYVEVPKCACTTIKGNLGRYELRASGASDEQVAAFVAHPHTPTWQSPFVKPFQLSPDAFDAFVGAPDVLRFAFVRNPFARAASGYLDKVVPGKVAMERLRPYLADVMGVEVDAVQGRDVSFEQFLLALSRCPPALRNTHFRPQVQGLAADLIAYDLLAPVERLEPELTAIARRTGMHGFRYDRHPFTRGTADRLVALYDHVTADLVRQIFVEDFRQLGYALDLDAALEPPRR